jgi:hypothetical protein
LDKSIVEGRGRGGTIACRSRAREGVSRATPAWPPPWMQPDDGCDAGFGAGAEQPAVEPEASGDPGDAPEPGSASPQVEAPWPPRPAELAAWHVQWRERWGLRANELEAAGFAWREAERQAFDEVRAARAASKSPEFKSHQGGEHRRVG